MLPLSDGLHPRRFPLVNVALIAANVAVWLLYELPNLGSAVHQSSFYPCAVDNTCHAPQPWGISWLTVDVHARELEPPPRQHALPRDLRQERRGRVRAPPLPRLLHRGRVRGDDDADGGHTAVRHGVRRTRSESRCQRRDRRGARRLLRPLPDARASAPSSASWFIKVPAWLYLGGWFVYQLVEGNFGLASASSNGGGVAFFAHIGGFVFGVVVTRALLVHGRLVPQSRGRAARRWRDVPTEAHGPDRVLTLASPRRPPPPSRWRQPPSGSGRSGASSSSCCSP